MDKLRSRTWAEIHLKNIVTNYNIIRSELPIEVGFVGVVKANAYGHGAVKVSKLLEKAGCEYLAVATIEEAKELRNHNIKSPILILGYTPPEFADELIEYGITQAVSSFDMAKQLSEIAVNLKGTLKAHIKIDSGMGRLGFKCHSGLNPSDEILTALNLPNLDFEGIFTHFAVSEIENHDYTDMQYRVFNELVDQIELQSNKKFKYRHCSNSGATLSHPDKHLDLIRPGIAMYGLYPGENKRISLKPVMELKTRIYQIKDFEKGSSVSYGRTYIADKKRKIAVIPIGYADGLHRVLSNKLEVLVHGIRVKQVGNICMDMCMIDVTNVPDAAVGDIVTIFGNDGNSFISIDELAEKAGTISYELLCAVSPRIPRIYDTDV
jgi:alanine racemase